MGKQRLFVVSVIIDLYLVSETALRLGTSCNFFSIGMLLYTLSGVLFLILSFISLAYFIWKVRQKKWVAARPLLVNAITLTTLLFLPLESWWTDFFFHINALAFQEVVTLVEGEQVRAGEYHLAELPVQFRYLSRCGGEIMIDESEGVTRVFFYTYRDMFDDFSGYLYRSDFQPPQDNDFLDRFYRLRPWTSCRPLRPHWYWCHNA